MPWSPEDLQHIATRTLAHYEQHAQSYWEGTRDHDVSQNIAALLRPIAGDPCLLPSRLLASVHSVGGSTMALHFGITQAGKPQSNAAVS